MTVAAHVTNYNDMTHLGWYNAICFHIVVEEIQGLDALYGFLTKNISDGKGFLKNILSVTAVFRKAAIKSLSATTKLRTKEQTNI